MVCRSLSEVAENLYGGRLKSKIIFLNTRFQKEPMAELTFKI